MESKLKVVRVTRETRYTDGERITSTTVVLQGAGYMSLRTLAQAKRAIDGLEDVYMRDPTHFDDAPDVRITCDVEEKSMVFEWMSVEALEKPDEEAA